jgi:hypothetical protein
MALYNSAREAFPDAEVFVAATNDTKTRPFPFAVKEKLAKVAGVEPGHFVQVKSPFQPKEITQNYNPDEDIVIFVRSQKDMKESPIPGGVKKNGEPAYFQPFKRGELEPFGKHAYMAYLPTVEFGPGITSATEIRNAWPKLDEKRKTAMVMSLYPATQKNPKLAANVVQMLDMAMGNELNEAFNKDYDSNYDDKDYKLNKIDIPHDALEYAGLATSTLGVIAGIVAGSYAGWNFIDPSIWRLVTAPLGGIIGGALGSIPGGMLYDKSSSRKRRINLEKKVVDQFIATNPNLKKDLSNFVKALINNTPNSILNNANELVYLEISSYDHFLDGEEEDPEADYRVSTDISSYNTRAIKELKLKLRSTIKLIELYFKSQEENWENIAKKYNISGATLRYIYDEGLKLPPIEEIWLEGVKNKIVNSGVPNQLLDKLDAEHETNTSNKISTPVNSAPVKTAPTKSPSQNKNVNPELEKRLAARKAGNPTYGGLEEGVGDIYSIRQMGDIANDLGNGYVLTDESYDDDDGFTKAMYAVYHQEGEDQFRFVDWVNTRSSYRYTQDEFNQAVQQVVDSDSKNNELSEVRTNPDRNRRPGSGKYELINYAEDNINDKDNWAVSMTAEPKLGINPQVGISEDTPKGIYFYPLRYFMQMADRDESLPWGDNFPYLQLFQYDRSGEMTKDTQVDPAKLKQALRQYCPEEVIQQAIDEPEYDGTPYWFIYDCLSRLGKSDETNVIRWNKVLRDLGFTSVYDDGGGWIAHNEPTQGVVLDPRIIKQHKMFVNRNPTMQHRRYDIQGLSDAIGWSSYFQRESQLQRIYNHPDEKKVRLDVAKSMLRPFLGKTSEEAKEMGYDKALKAAADKVIEILKQSVKVTESLDYLEEK